MEDKESKPFYRSKHQRETVLETPFYKVCSARQNFSSALASPQSTPRDKSALKQLEIIVENETSISQKTSSKKSPSFGSGSNSTKERTESPKAQKKSFGEDLESSPLIYCFESKSSPNPLKNYILQVTAIKHMSREAIGLNNVKLLDCTEIDENKAEVACQPFDIYLSVEAYCEETEDNSQSGDRSQMTQSYGEFTLEDALQIAYDVTCGAKVYADMQMVHHGIRIDNIYLIDGYWVLGPPMPESYHHAFRLENDKTEYDYFNEKFSKAESSFKNARKIDIWALGTLFIHLASMIKDSKNPSANSSEPQKHSIKQKKNLHTLGHTILQTLSSTINTNSTKTNASNASNPSSSLSLSSIHQSPLFSSYRGPESAKTLPPPHLPDYYNSYIDIKYKSNFS